MDKNSNNSESKINKKRSRYEIEDDISDSES